MKLFTRFTLYELSLAAAEGIVPFAFVFFLKRLFDFMDLLVADGASPVSVAGMVFAILPSIMVLAFPIAMLLSGLMVYGRMAGDHEITALRAAGYTVRQLLLPSLIAGTAALFLTLWWSQRAAPKGLRAFQSIAVEVLENTAGAGIDPGAFNRLGNFVFYPGSVGDGRMESLRIFENRDGGVAGVISAPTGVIRFDPAEERINMRLQDGLLHQSAAPFRDVAIRFERMTVSIGIPNIVGRFANVGHEVRSHGRSSLLRRIEAYKKGIEDTEDRREEEYYFREMKLHQIELARRSALPAACPIMAVLGALLGMRARSSRRSSCYGLTVAAVFLYYTLLSFGSAYAEDGSIPAWAGVWAPNVAAAAVAAYLYKAPLSS